MSCTFPIVEPRRATLAAIIWLCAAPLACGQQPDQPQPPPQQPAPQPAPVQPQVFRYPEAVSGSRFLTSVYGPTRPTYVTQRLTHVPSMFGDSFVHGQTLMVTETVVMDTVSATLDLPVAGGPHLLVAENNKALPTDRVYVNYDHYHNALLYSVVQTPGDVLNRRVSLDRFTFGLEKTFFDGVWSAELRVPFVGENDLQFSSGALAASVDSSVFGNISLILKTLLFADDNFAFSTGLGLEFPTGDAAQAQVASELWTLENDAFHLHPFLAVMGDSANDVFYHGFLQLDVPANGNDLRTTALPGTAGTLNDQTLLRLHIGAGYWFCRNARRVWLTGVAGLLELHYTSTLKDTDTLTLAPRGGLAAELTNRRNHYSLLNLTTGLHVELTPDTLLRLAVALPLRREDNRFFDAEPMLQLTRRF